MINRIHFYLCLLFSIYFTNAGATQYHTISSGPTWSNEKGGADYSCGPTLGVDSVFVHHAISVSAVSRTYSPGSYLLVDGGGVVNITANNAERIIQGEIVIAQGGEINAGNGFNVTIESTGSFTVLAGGVLEFGQNGTFVNEGTLILDGQIITCVNSNIQFRGGSTVIINGTLSL